MARRQHSEGEEEGADEALRVRGLRAVVDEVRVPRTLMLRRMESLPRRRPQAPQHVEPVQPEDKAQQAGRVREADADPRRQRLLVPVAHPRAVALPTGPGMERWRPAS